MPSENKEITIRNVDQSETPKMISSIFDSLNRPYSEILAQQRQLHELGWKIYRKHNREYKRAERPGVFWGLTTPKEVMMQANNYALKQTRRFFSAFDGQTNTAINNWIRIARESPTEFLSAIKSVLTDGNGQAKLQASDGDADKLLEALVQNLQLREGNRENDVNRFAGQKRTHSKIAQD